MIKNWIPLSGKLTFEEVMDMSKTHSVMNTKIGIVATITQFRTYAKLAVFVEAQQRNFKSAVAFMIPLQTFVSVH
jgi:hypothetical protein